MEESQAQGQQQINLDNQVNPNNTATIPVNPQEAMETKPSFSLEDIVPSEYKEKGYMNKYKDINSLFKSFDSLQSMIGKRGNGIPQENATEEEWNKFYTEFGRPETSDGYEFKFEEGVEQDEKTLKEYKEIAHKLGLNQKQAQELINFDLQRLNGTIEKQKLDFEEQVKQQDAEFDKLANDTFGQNVDNVLKVGNDMLSKYAPDAMKEHLEGLDNKSLILLSSVLNSIHKDYIAEDQDVSKVNQANMGDSRETIMDLMASDAYRNPFNAQHDDVKKRVTAFYNRTYK